MGNLNTLQSIGLIAEVRIEGDNSWRLDSVSCFVYTWRPGFALLEIWRNMLASSFSLHASTIMDASAVHGATPAALTVLPTMMQKIKPDKKTMVFRSAVSVTIKMR